MLRLRGRIDRPALAEITETDPPPPTGAMTRFDVRGSTAFMDCSSLATHAEVTVRDAAVTWRRDRDGLIGDISWPAGASRGSFTVSVSLGGPILLAVAGPTHVAEDDADLANA